MILEDAYAHYLGVAAELVELPSNFTPLPDKPYITICTGADTPSRMYDYYSKVLVLLGLQDIVVVQIGLPSDPLVGLDYRGRTLYQNTFLIENALCHVGNDHVFNHIAASKQTPVVGLYSVTPATTTAPTGDKVIILESDRNGLKPSFADQEHDKGINLIKPEKVAQAIAGVLKIPYEANVETRFIGKQFFEPRIDVVPDFPVQPGLKGRLACRFDLCNNMQGLIHFYNLYSGPLFTSDPVEASFFAAWKPRIPQVIYFLDRNYSKDFIEVLHKSGIPYELVTAKTGEALAKLKMELFDYSPVKSLHIPDEVLEPDWYFDTQHVFLSRGQAYPSRYHWSEGITAQGFDFKIGGAAQSKLFLENLQHYYIFKKV